MSDFEEWVQTYGPKLLGERLYGYVSIVMNFVFNKSNPIFQTLYLSLLAGGLYCFFWEVEPHVPWLTMSPIHTVTVPLAVSACLVSFIMCSFADPGTITATNVQTHKALYRIDGDLYVRKTCHTCNLDRPARSKHCRTCNKCVARFDHHCIWMNSCIGINNIRWFLMFLLSHTIISIYGIYVTGLVVMEWMTRTRLWDAHVLNENRQHVPITYSIMFQHVVFHQRLPCALIMFLTVIGALLGGFFSQHMWYVIHNWTTNETFRFQDLEESYHSESFQAMLQEWEEKGWGDESSEQRKARAKRSAGKGGGGGEAKKNSLADMTRADVEAMKGFVLGGMKRIYDRGVWRNVMEVVYPEGVMKSVEVRGDGKKQK